MPNVDDSSLAGAMSEKDLHSGFATFVEAAQRLESSYTALKKRAAEIDVQLARANARLAETLQEREALLHALPVGVVAQGVDGAVRWSNPEAERIAVLGRDEDFDFVAAKPGLHESGAETVAVSRIDLAGGGSMTVLEDRSRMVELEREVDRLDRIAGLSELALGVAHEIKNPLNGVMGFASLLERHEDPEQIRRCARKVSAGMRDVDTIVKGMLAFAHPAAGTAATPGSVRMAVLSAMSEAGVAGDRVRCDGAVDLHVDKGTLCRVLSNLLRNSFEAGARQVQVRVAESDDDVVIEVEDDGPGIEAGLSSRMFEPFVSSKAKGHGLGLALAARVLSFLGGSIECVVTDRSTDASTGARFRVRMPRMPAPLATEAAGG